MKKGARGVNGAKGLGNAWKDRFEPEAHAVPAEGAFCHELQWRHGHQLLSEVWRAQGPALQSLQSHNSATRFVIRAHETFEHERLGDIQVSPYLSSRRPVAVEHASQTFLTM